MNTQNDVYQLLGSRVKMLSANGGYKASIDPVLLASSIPAGIGQRVLDVGCGTGAATFCLMARVPGVQVLGVDYQIPLIKLANKIASYNELHSRARFVALDFLKPAKHLQPNSFEHVMANPPHLKSGSGTISQDPLKALANMEGNAKLRDWVSFCLKSVKNGGTVTFVHRFDRKDELILLLRDFGSVKVIPLWPKIKDVGAKRVLVQIIKGGHLTINTTDGIVLHTDGNTYTPEANAILRDAEAFKI
jgi:tRNA1(Val) A37 N6-methylase TrmN6